MGKSFAPSLANIYLKPLDLQALAYNTEVLKQFFRFIDEIFFIWLASRKELEIFQQFINNNIIHQHHTYYPSFNH